MKKIVTVSVIFALLAGVAVWEMLYSTAAYKDIYSTLTRVEKSMEANEDNINNPDTLELMDKVIKKWNSAREVLFCLGNHTVLRNADEKLISLNAMIKTNHKEDALVMVVVAKSVIKALTNDSHPVPTNLF